MGTIRTTTLDWRPMPFQVHFAIWVRWTPDRPDEETAAAHRSLDRQLRAWCRRQGYAVVDGTDEVQEIATVGLPDYSQLILTATVTARWDGVWGDLRRELDVDGLLPSRDRQPRLPAPIEWDPVAPWHRPIEHR